jgi:hypothetical protein
MPQVYDPVNIGPTTPVAQCQGCGALVMTETGRYAHDNFHDSIRYHGEVPPTLGP